MSGGAFGYRDINLSYLSEDIEAAIADYTKTGHIGKNEEALILHSKKLIKKLKKLQKEIKALDYFLSGDSSTWEAKK